MNFKTLLLTITVCLFSVLNICHAQNCYKKGLNKGQKYYDKGDYLNAMNTWKDAKSCADADTIKINELIGSAQMKYKKKSDFDMDGVENDRDKCPHEKGTVESDGCPCADSYRWISMDYVYDNKLDSAVLYLEMAKNCSDAGNIPSLAELEAKITSLKDNKNALEVSDEKTYKAVQHPPAYKDGEGAMLQFLYANLKYPVLARENGVEGTVYIQFIVETDGHLSHIKIIRDVGAGLGYEAARVVKMMPLWKPAKEGNNPVRCYFNLPVKFKLY